LADHYSEEETIMADEQPEQKRYQCGSDDLNGCGHQFMFPADEYPSECPECGAIFCGFECCGFMAVPIEGDV
jgi:hypothetical protein